MEPLFFILYRNIFIKMDFANINIPKQLLMKKIFLYREKALSLL